MYSNQPKGMESSGSESSFNDEENIQVRASRRETSSSVATETTDDRPFLGTERSAKGRLMVNTTLLKGNKAVTTDSTANNLHEAMRKVKLDEEGTDDVSRLRRPSYSLRPSISGGNRRSSMSATHRRPSMSANNRRQSSALQTAGFDNDFRAAIAQVQEEDAMSPSSDEQESPAIISKERFDSEPAHRRPSRRESLMDHDYRAQRKKELKGRRCSFSQQVTVETFDANQEIKERQTPQRRRSSARRRNSFQDQLENKSKPSFNIDVNDIAEAIRQVKEEDSMGSKSESATSSPSSRMSANVRRRGSFQNKLLPTEKSESSLRKLVTRDGDVSTTNSTSSKPRISSIGMSARKIWNQKKKTSDLAVSDVESIDAFHNREDDNNSLAQSTSNYSKGYSETGRNRMNWMNMSKYKDSNLDVMSEATPKPKQTSIGDVTCNIDFGRQNSSHTVHTQESTSFRRRASTRMFTDAIRKCSTLKLNASTLMQLFVVLTITISYAGYFKSESLHSSMKNVVHHNVIVRNEVSSMAADMQQTEDLVKKLQSEISDLYDTNERLEEEVENAQYMQQQNQKDVQALHQNDHMQKRVLDLKSRGDNLTIEMKKLMDSIQLESYRQVLERFGNGPYEVKFDVSLPDEAKTKGSFTIEMFPLDKMPHSIHLFLEQVDHGLWDGHKFTTNAPHLLSTETEPSKFSAFEEKGLSSLVFPEYHAEHPHNKWTVGFSNIGPSFFINKEDNAEKHGPSSEDAIVESDAHPCFGFVSSGKEILEKIFSLSTNDEHSGFGLVSPIEIVQATVLDNGNAIEVSDLHLKSKHFFDSSSHVVNRRANVFLNEEVDCTIYEVKGVKVDDEEHSPTYFRCVDELDDSSLYLVEDLPEDMVKTISSGESTLGVTEKAITSDETHGKVIHLQNRTPKLYNNLVQNRSGRSLNVARTTGTKQLLLVRVTFAESNGILRQPKTTEDQLRNTVLGFTDVYTRCSGGKLSIIAAQGNNLNNGVLTVKINRNLSGMTWDVAEMFVSAHLQNLGIHSTTYDLVSYIFPDTVQFNGMAGLAYIGWYLSMFSDSWVMNKYIALHELGHNMGHDHSGLGDAVYGDKTGFMGQGDNFSTNVCFNGPKSWYFGWYSDKQRSVDPSIRGFKGNMIGLDDYLEGNVGSSSDQLIVQITSRTQDSIYLMFNHNSGATSGNTSIGNRLAVTTQQKENSKSFLLALLDANNSEYRTSNWNGSGSDLVVKVCSVSLESEPCNANIIAYIDSPGLRLSCSSSLNDDPLGDSPRVDSPPVCTEKLWYKYVHKIRRTTGIEVKKSCKWLSKLKARKPARAEFLCQRDGKGGNPKASEICCDTCSSF